MAKTKEELLKQFTKANKVYRQKLADRSGLSIPDYVIFLSKKDIESKTSIKSGPSTKPTKTKVGKQIVHIVNIIDASGSMNHQNKIGIANKAVQSDLELIKDQSKVNYTYTLVSFSYNYDIIVHKILATPETVGIVKPFRTRGMTALNQAIGETLENVSKHVPVGEKVVVTIATDGGENASKGKYANKEYLSRFIKELEGRGFTITFVGTNEDTEDVIRNLGIDRTNTMSYDGSGAGLTQTFSTRMDSLVSFSKGVAEGQDVSRGFYKKIVKL